MSAVTSKDHMKAKITVLLKSQLIQVIQICRETSGSFIDHISIVVDSFHNSHCVGFHWGSQRDIDSLLICFACKIINTQ